MEEQKTTQEIEIPKYNRIIISSPPCTIPQQSIENLKKDFFIDEKGEFALKQDYETKLSIAFVNLTPAKILSLRQQHPFRKGIIVFLNYDSIKNASRVIALHKDFILQQEKDKPKKGKKSAMDSVMPFFKCKDPAKMLETQFESLEKFKSELDQDQLHIDGNFSNQVLEQCEIQHKNPYQDSEYIEKMTQELQKFIKKLENATKIVETNVVNTVMAVSIPCSGKSTLSQRFKNFRKQNKDYFVGCISTDQIVAIAMKKLKDSQQQDQQEGKKEDKNDKYKQIKKNKENQDQGQNENEEQEDLQEEDDEDVKKQVDQMMKDNVDLYFQALKEVKGFFGWFLAGYFKKIYNEPRKYNIIYQDKNIVPFIMQESLTQTVKARQTQEIIPLVRRITVIYPQVFDKENLIQNFPFTYGFIVQCCKRVLNRKGHETLEGNDSYKLGVIIRFVQAFINVKEFNDEYFKQFDGIYRHQPYPFISEKGENINKINEEDQKLIYDLINQPNQEQTQTISEKPETQKLVESLKKYELEITDEEEQNSNFQKLITLLVSE